MLGRLNPPHAIKLRMHTACLRRLPVRKMSPPKGGLTCPTVGAGCDCVAAASSRQARGGPKVNWTLRRPCENQRHTLPIVAVDVIVGYLFRDFAWLGTRRDIDYTHGRFEIAPVS